MSIGTFRADIEGLRGLAVALVVADHLWGVPRGGFVGVDVFFVISGYVITAGLLREYEATGTISFRSFSVRRLRRLLPAALLVIVVTIVVARLLFFTPRFLGVLWDAAAAATSVQNWRLIRQGTDYFAAEGASPLQHFWSLSVEEQFYVFWPLVFLGIVGFAARRGVGSRRALWAVIAAAAVLSFATSIVESAFRPGWSYFSLESRVWELAVGALLAVLAPRLCARSPLVKWGLLIGGVVLVVGSAFVIDGSVPFPGPWALVPVIGAASVIAAGEGGAAPWAAVLTNRPARSLGRVSYSLYVWHMPAVVFVGLLLWWSEPLASVAALLASLLLAGLTFRFVESRWRHPRRSPRRNTWGRRRERGFAVGVVVALLVLAAVQARGPGSIVDVPEVASDAPPAAEVAPFGDDEEIVSAIQTASTAETWSSTGASPDAVWPGTSAAQTMSRNGCLVAAEVAAIGVEEVAASCTFGESDASRTAVVFGDSIAMSWLPTLVAALVPLGWTVVGLGVESCPSASVVSEERTGRAEFAGACEAARGNALDEIDRIEPDLVVLSSGLGSFERLSSGASGASAIVEWREGLRRTIDGLSGSVGSVAVLSSPPETMSIGQCASPLASPAACIGSPSAGWVAKTAAEEGIRDAPPAGDGVAVDVIPVVDWFCTEDDDCPAAVDGTVVTVDGGHLTIDYAERLALVLRERLAPILRVAASRP